MENTQTFEPVDTFSWKINRSERTLQVRLLVPLLDNPEGRAWFLHQLKCPCSAQEARAAEVFHFCFPLGHIFTEDLHAAREAPQLEDQFIACYNKLFGLPDGFGAKEFWRTTPGGTLRHPKAVGERGWSEDLLKKHIPDSGLRQKARELRQMLGTEADVFIQTASHVIIVECKYKTRFSKQQYDRQKMTGKTLARRLGKVLHFGLVCEKDRDPAKAKIEEPYVTWDQVKAKLAGLQPG